VELATGGMKEVAARPSRIRGNDALMCCSKKKGKGLGDHPGTLGIDGVGEERGKNAATRSAFNSHRGKGGGNKAILFFGEITESLRLVVLKGEEGA